MFLILLGPGGSFVTTTMKVLMLRDNVQHHLQAGRPHPGYQLIHDVADAAVGLREASPPARQLWSELSLAFSGIRDLPIDDIAMSIRTRAIMTDARVLPVVRGTVLLRLSGWGVPLRLRGLRTLGDLFVGLMEGVERVTLSGGPRAHVNVLKDVRQSGALHLEGARKG